MKNSYSVLYLTYDGLADPLGRSQVLPYLNGLAERGWKFWVISFEKQEGEVQLHESITWIHRKYHKKPPVLSTIFDIYRLWRTAEVVVRENSIEVVHCRSYIASLVGLKLKRRYGSKFIFDMRGFWADERVEGGLWNLSNPAYKWIYRYFKKKEKEFFVESDSIVSLTEAGKSELLRASDLQYPTTDFKDKITVIPTCVDTDLFNPYRFSESERSKLRESLGIGQDDYVLMYVGSLGTWYMLEEMLAFFCELKAIKSDSRFIILTNTLNIKINDDRVVVRTATREEIPGYLAICNVTICFIRSTFSKKASAPTKIGESLAMGKPVIVNSGWGDVGTIFQDNKQGQLIRGFKEAPIRSDIKRLLGTSWEHEKIRDKAIPQFGLRAAVRAYDGLYRGFSDGVHKISRKLGLAEADG